MIICIPSRRAARVGQNQHYLLYSPFPIHRDASMRSRGGRPTTHIVAGHTVPPGAPAQPGGGARRWSLAHARLLWGQPCPRTGNPKEPFGLP